ncbi:ABC transporter permease [Clostridium novyi]|uniref:ABC transporter permease n=1 Tax=Clostridium novyi TaxID=1542 RepID=UPI000B2E064D|nr:ABC transporter permease [Clostridium novyi]
MKLRQSRGESIKNLLNIPKDAGRNFYKNEDSWYQSYIEKNARNESEKKLALSMWSSVKKPYTYYSGFEAWSDGISHIVFFSFILMIIVGVFAGSIIVQDNENGIDEIIKSTESGRKGLTVAKIVIPLIMASIIYLCGVGIYAVLLKLLLPIDALSTSIQVVGRSLFPYTLRELIRYVFVLGGIGVLVIGAFSTWLSSVVKKSSRAIQISTLTVVVGFLLFSVIDINSPIINVIKMLIPGEVVFADIGAVNFVSGLVFSYTGVLYFESRIEDFPDDYAKNFYKCWREKSIALIQRIPKNSQPKAMKELSKVKTPFYKYPGYYIWNLAINNLKGIYLIIIFLVTFFAASTYSDSMEDGSMEIIRATKRGKLMMGIRLLPTIIYGLLLNLVATLSTIGIVGSYTGLETLKSSLKVFALFSIGNFTLGDGIFLMFLSELLGVLSITTIMGWVSYKTAKTSLSVSIGIAINILYIIAAYFIKIPGKISQLVINAFPLASAQIINEVSGFRFDMGIWRPYEVMISMIVVFSVFGMILKYKICSKEI